MFFKDLMARFGKGAAKVDLVLDRNQFTLGDFVSGKLVVRGGEVEQQINKIEVHLMVAMHVKGQEYVHTVTSIPFYQSFTIHPGEIREFPFQYQLPNHLLISGNYVRYFFKTELDIAGGLDQLDHDYIEILPPQPLQQVFLALDYLGFREKHDSREFNGYVQEFEFYPASYLSGQVKELELAASISPEGIRLLLELEVYSFGHEKEIKREIFLSHEQLQSVPELAQHLRQILDEMIQQSHLYMHSSHSHHHSYGGFSDEAAAIGGFAAGILGGVLLSEMMDGDDDEEDDGGFLEDLFEEED